MSDSPVNFLDLLKQPPSAHPDRPNLPGAKTFYGKIASMEADSSTVKHTPLYRFRCRLTDPGPDVTPEELRAITSSGFNLGDYDVFMEFYITPNAMPIFRRFYQSIGFSDSVPYMSGLKLGEEDGIPTAETQEVIRGIDVVVRTQAADDKGRVYARLDSMAGVKR